MNDYIYAASGNQQDQEPAKPIIRSREKSRPGAGQKKIIQFTGGTSSDNNRDD